MAKNEQTAGPYWTKNWIEAMWRFTVENFVEFDTGAVDFEALGREEYEFRKALFYRNFKNSQRAKEAFAEVKESYKAHVESGRQGGRPPKAKEEEQREGEGSLRLGGHVTPSRTCRPPRDFEEVKDFIAQNGLDYDDARLWWERNYVERDGIDKDGKPIKNWKGALVNACKAEDSKRRNA